MSGKNMIANRYEVVRHIGQGGMADVFLAIDTILNRHVAVKILRADLSSDAVSILRFEREAQAATALAHKNIVEVYDVGDYKGHHYIVMEYVPGKTLKQVIRERGPLMNEEGIDIMKQLVSAIAEAHSRGIIHRDIKPQNVIVKSDGSIKMLDFGIATAKGSLQLTQANNVMGSVHYLAPELARGQQATVQSDIYALGIVMFEIFAGDVPFKADQAVQIALMHLREPMPSLRAINPMVPQSVENIVLKAAAKNPEDRYSSAEEMLKDLDTCLLAERQNEPRVTIRKYKDLKKSYEMSFSEGKPVDDDEEDIDDTFERRANREKPSHKKKAGRGKWIVIGVTCLLCITVVLLYLFEVIPHPQVVIPDVLGKDLEEVRTLVKDSGLTVDEENLTYALSETYEEGDVISITPETGEEVKRGTGVSLVVSSGIGIPMPDFTGRNIESAMKTLSQFPLVAVHEKTETGTGTEAGNIIRQEGVAAGELFSREEPVDITLVYEAYPEFTIPSDIIGKTVDDAYEQLTEMGIKVLTSTLDSSTLSEDELKDIQYGTVVRSDPSVGSSYTQKDGNYVVLYYY